MNLEILVQSMVKRRRAFICGWPVEHSRSPIIHNYWIKKHRLDGVYIKQPVKPENFAGFLASLAKKDLLGGNVTIPHKEQAFNLIKYLDPVAKRLGAVNTVWFEDTKLHGANTDGYGFLANLDQCAPGWDNNNTGDKEAIVLGAGGASRAIIDAILMRGFKKVHVINRTLSRASKLVDLFGPAVSAHQWNDIQQLMKNVILLVNTTSMGMNHMPLLEIDLNPLPDNCVVSDIVYAPLQTLLLKQANSRGLRTVDGLGMLLHQAVPGFELWFGTRPEVTDDLRQLIIRDLAEKQ